MVEISHLTIATDKGKFLLKDINLNVERNKIKGMTGASGSGKSTLIKIIMGLPDYNTKIVSGEIVVNSIDILSLSSHQKRQMLGLKIGFIPQQPMASFFPYQIVGKQMVTALSIRKKISRNLARKKILDMLEILNLKDPLRIIKSYPSQLSGGMLQRLVIANLLILQPPIILADEPTSALDDENKSILLNYLLKLKNNTSILFISHDISALKKVCDSICIMERGQIKFDGLMDFFINKKMSNNDIGWIENFQEELKKTNKENWKWENL